MSNIQLAWIKQINCSEILPVAYCEIIANKQTTHALISNELVDENNIESCLVQLSVEQDVMGNNIICGMLPMSFKLTEHQYSQIEPILCEAQSSYIMRFLNLISLITAKELKPFIDFMFNQPYFLEKMFITPTQVVQQTDCGITAIERRIDIAEMAYSYANLFNHSDIECQCALIAGLLNNIGKTCYVCNPSKTANKIMHEGYTLAVLAEPLARLYGRNIPLRNMIKAMIISQPHNYRPCFAIEYLFLEVKRISHHTLFDHQQLITLPDAYYRLKRTYSLF